MKFARFEDLPVWKEGSRLFVSIDALCEGSEVRRRGDLADQLHRAALSITNNIAEGFETGTTEQLLTHLYYAKGSAGEVRSMLIQMLAIPRFANLKSEISNLRSQSESVSRQIAAFAQSLQNSDIKGHRYLNNATKEQFDRRKRSDAFLERLKTLAPFPSAETRADQASKADGDPKLQHGTTPKALPES